MVPGIAAMAILLLLPFTGLQEADYVSVTARLSQDGVEGGSSLRAALIVTVRRGWHINSASPSDENLIATAASFLPPPGISVADVHYPRGLQRKFAFSDTPVDVYEGSVIILLRITAAGGMQPGQYTLPVDVSYQACNSDICLAPATAHIDIPVQVLSPDVTPRHLNRELFTGGADR
jgi:DsbC/DsbD-like thiol-disulfide interchange protein